MPELRKIVLELHSVFLQISPANCVRTQKLTNYVRTTSEQALKSNFKEQLGSKAITCALLPWGHQSIEDPEKIKVSKCRYSNPFDSAYKHPSPCGIWPLSPTIPLESCTGIRFEEAPRLEGMFGEKMRQNE